MLHMKRWIDGGVDSLVKWVKVSYNTSHHNYLQAENEAFCSLLNPKYVSIGCYPCTRQILPLEKLLSSKCLRENLKDEEHGTHTCYTKQQVIMPIVLGHQRGASCSEVIYQCLISLSFSAVDNLLQLHAFWCCLCQQAVPVSYARQAVKLVDSGLMPRKVTDGRNKELNIQNLGASSCTTVLFHRYDQDPPLMAFIKARQ